MDTRRKSKFGKAKIMKAYNLPCRYVIHNVCPIWNEGRNEEEDLLTNRKLESSEDDKHNKRFIRGAKKSRN